MSRRFIQICLLWVVLAIAVGAAHAQLPNPYGASIDIVNAKKVAASQGHFLHPEDGGPPDGEPPARPAPRRSGPRRSSRRSGLVDPIAQA